MWEVFTCGGIPYIDIPVMYHLDAIKDGLVMEIPQNEACSDEM